MKVGAEVEDLGSRIDTPRDACEMGRGRDRTGICAFMQARYESIDQRQLSLLCMFITERELRDSMLHIF